MPNYNISQHKPEAPRTGTGQKLTTKYRTMLSMEIRGCTNKEIAQALGMNEAVVCRIKNLPHYLAARDEILGGMDRDFINMKGDAVAALKAGLAPSTNMSERLRAAEMWFKARGYGGYSKEPERNDAVTAEDVVKRLLDGGAEKVTITAERSSEAGAGLTPEGTVIENEPAEQLSLFAA